MSESTGASIETRGHSNDIFSALTVEVALYASLFFLALLVRLFILDWSPLNADEARQALGALSFVHGNPSFYTGSPLLFILNALFFLLFGASDLTARLASVFFGAALVLLPLLCRRDLGRSGACIASALLAVSPSLVFFSRTLDGVVPAATCALAAILFYKRYLDTRIPRDLYWAVASAALALLTSPDVWTIALALTVYAIALRVGLTASLESREGESESFAQSPSIGLTVRALLFFVLVLVGTATILLLHRQGLGATLDLLGAWFDSLRPGGSFPDVLRLLLVHEPLALFFGLAALADIFFAPQQNRTGILGLLGFWFLIAFFFLSFSANNSPSRIVVLVVPLALLAGSKMAAWIKRVADAFGSTSLTDLLSHEAPILAVAAGSMSFLSIVLAELAQRGNILSADALVRFFGSARENPDLGGTIVALLFLIVFAAISVLAITTLGSERAINAGVVFALTILSIWTVRQTAMLNFPAGRALNPQEWMVARAASPNLRDLVSDLEGASRWRANDTHTLDVAVDSSLGPILEWNLRDFSRAQFLQRPAANSDAQAMVLPGNAPPSAEGWIAQKYQIEQVRGAPAGALRTLIFRDVGGVETVSAVLWLPKPQ